MIGLTKLTEETKETTETAEKIDIIVNLIETEYTGLDNGR